MKIIWTKSALQDLLSTYEYISGDNNLAAQNILERLTDLLQVLNQQPEIGRLGRIKNTREVLLTPYPFVLAYRIKNKNIQILAFMHTSRKWL